MEKKLEKVKRLIPKMPIIEWLFYPAIVIMAMTFTTISTFATFTVWVFASIVLIVHVILSENDPMILPRTDKTSTICFAVALFLYGLTL